MKLSRTPAHLLGKAAQNIGALSLLTIGWIGCSDNSPVSLSDVQPAQKPAVMANRLEDIGDYFRLDDDMLLSKYDDNHQRIIADLFSDKPAASGEKTASCSYTNTKTWPNSVVPYYFKGSWTDADKKIAYTSFDAWANVSNLCFVELPSGGDYILTMSKIADDANSCIAGQSTLGYNQYPLIELKASWIKTDIVIHELGHTLCFQHEHQRADRDIIIKWDNIKPDYQKYYQTFSSAPVYHTTFDVASIMHYRSMTTCALLAYDINKPVLTNKNGGIIDNKVLSSGDITGVQAKYSNGRQTMFSVAYRSSTADEPTFWDWKRSDFLTKYNSLYASGYRLKRFDITMSGTQDNYFGVFQKSTATEELILGWTRTDFINKYNTMYSKGYRINLMQVYSLNGSDRYSATFRPATAEETWVLGYTRADFITKYNTLKSQGWRVNQFDVYLASDKTERYGAFFRKSSANENWCLGYALADMPGYVKQQYNSGYRLNQLSAFNVNGKLVYSAFFRPGTVSEPSWFGIKRNGFEYLNNKMFGSGSRLHMTCATYD